MPRDLHDDTAQALVTITRQLDAYSAARECNCAERLEVIRHLADGALERVRQFAKELRPWLASFAFIP